MAELELEPWLRFLRHKCTDGFDDFPAIDANVEKLLADAERSFCSIVKPTAVVSQAGTVPSTSGHSYDSPKSEKAVNTAIAGAAPVKTEQKTNWSLGAVGQESKRSAIARRAAV